MHISAAYSLAALNLLSCLATDNQAVVMLDMHNIVDAIHVSAGATLELVNITVSPIFAALATKLSLLDMWRAAFYSTSTWHYCKCRSAMLS